MTISSSWSSRDGKVECVIPPRPPKESRAVVALIVIALSVVFAGGVWLWLVWK